MRIVTPSPINILGLDTLDRGQLEQEEAAIPLLTPGSSNNVIGHPVNIFSFICKVKVQQRHLMEWVNRTNESRINCGNRPKNREKWTLRNSKLN